MAYTEEDLKRAKNILQNHSSCSIDELLEALKIFKCFKFKEIDSLFAVLYEKGITKKDSAKTEKDFKEAADIFFSIPAYKNANDLGNNCQNQMENARIYEDALRRMDAAKTEDDFRTVADIFAEVSGFREANKLRNDCLNQINYLRDKKIFDDAIKIFAPA